MHLLAVDESRAHTKRHTNRRLLILDGHFRVAVLARDEHCLRGEVLAIAVDCLQVKDE